MPTETAKESLVWKRSLPLEKNMLMQREILLWDLPSRTGGARWGLSGVKSVRTAGEKSESSKKRAAVLGNKWLSLFHSVFRQLSVLILRSAARRQVREFVKWVTHFGRSEESKPWQGSAGENLGLPACLAGGLHSLQKLGRKLSVYLLPHCSHFYFLLFFFKKKIFSFFFTFIRNSSMGMLGVFFFTGGAPFIFFG